MSDILRVVVLGTGAMGAGIIRLLRQKRGIGLVGVYGRRRRPTPNDAGLVIGLDERIGLEISNDLADPVQGRIAGLRVRFPENSVA